MQVLDVGVMEGAHEAAGLSVDESTKAMLDAAQLAELQWVASELGWLAQQAIAGAIINSGRLAALLCCVNEAREQTGQQSQWPPRAWRGPKSSNQSVMIVYHGENVCHLLKQSLNSAGITNCIHVVSEANLR